jgi:hypothetical protein
MTEVTEVNEVNEVNEVTEVTKLTSHHHRGANQQDAIKKTNITPPSRRQPTRCPQGDNATPCKTDKIKREKQQYDQMAEKNKAQIKGSRGSQ